MIKFEACSVCRGCGAMFDGIIYLSLSSKKHEIHLYMELYKELRFQKGFSLQTINVHSHLANDCMAA